MSQHKGQKGFKNDVTRVRREVPEVIKNYQERRFWRFIDSPFTSKSHIKYYIGATLFMGGSMALTLYAMKRYDLFNHKTFRGTYEKEAEVFSKFPDLDRSIYTKQITFTEKFKQREKERLEQLQNAKKKRDQEEASQSTVNQSNQTTSNQTTKDASQKSKE